MIAPWARLRYPGRNAEFLMGAPMLRSFALVLALLGLTACTNPHDLDDKPVYLGEFLLGHNVVVAPNLTMGPASRPATEEEWIESMKGAIDERFNRYDGTQYVHLGISVEGYVLAIPGVPIVASPKSALIVKVTAWDDANGKKFHEKPEQVVIVETFSGSTIVGSGLTQSKEIQMLNLSRNAAKQIQNWLKEMNDKNGWFEEDGVPANDKPRAAKLVKVTPEAQEAINAKAVRQAAEAEAAASDPAATVRAAEDALKSR